MSQTQPEKRRLGTKAIIQFTLLAYSEKVSLKDTVDGSKVYLCGDNYFTCGHQPPRIDGRKWEKYRDQFWAQQAGTNLWFATALDGS